MTFLRHLVSEYDLAGQTHFKNYDPLSPTRLCQNLLDFTCLLGVFESYWGSPGEVDHPCSGHRSSLEPETGVHGLLHRRCSFSRGSEGGLELPPLRQGKH